MEPLHAGMHQKSRNGNFNPASGIECGQNFANRAAGATSAAQSVTLTNTGRTHSTPSSEVLLCVRLADRVYGGVLIL